jgi:hypothetical protein
LFFFFLYLPACFLLVVLAGEDTGEGSSGASSMLLKSSRHGSRQSELKASLRAKRA